MALYSMLEHIFSNLLPPAVGNFSSEFFRQMALYSMLEHIFSNLIPPAVDNLKVPSHQIRLCIKCYGWIGLDEYKHRGW